MNETRASRCIHNPGALFRSLGIAIGVLCGISCATVPKPETSLPAETPVAASEQAEEDVPAEPLRWHVLAAAVNTYPRLESERLVDRFFNRPMRLLAPGFSDVRTFNDVSDDGLMWPPHLGVGRVMGDRWDVFFEAGYSAGKVRTKATDPSLLLLPLHTDFEILRQALYAGVGADYYPWRTVTLGEYHGVAERLRAARPFLGSRLTWTWARYSAKAKVGFEPFGTLVQVRLADEWVIPSVNVCIGADIPLTPKSLATVNAGYNFFKERGYDFEGPAFTLGWKYFFR